MIPPNEAMSLAKAKRTFRISCERGRWNWPGKDKEMGTTGFWSAAERKSSFGYAVVKDGERSSWLVKKIFIWEN